MKSLLYLPSLLLAAALSISAIAATVGGSEGNDNGWLPLKNLEHPHVRAIALFAVIEYNKNPIGPLILLENVGFGETQWVYGNEGVAYRLVLVTSFVGVVSYSSDFEATVWDKGNDDFQLLSFVRL